ncbi:MAG: transglutaminase family protein [Rhodospirillaceae bacterium]|nr:transglutaminase family protein [Rhodospirillaceae bacterium]
MRYSVQHLTRYAYGAPVDLGYHLLRLVPPATPRQRLVEHAIVITPQPTRLAEFTDHFGNGIRHVAIEKRHETFAAELQAIVEVDAVPPPGEGPAWGEVAAALRDDGFPDAVAAAEFAYSSPLAGHDEAAHAFAAESFAPGRPIVDAAADLTHRINEEFAYVPGVTTVTTPVADVMKSRRGVCQDFAHAMIVGLRAHGLAARYVSGYLRTQPPPGAEMLRGADASHAWVSVWCGAELGWVDFDPTNDLLVGEEHIVLAYGRDFSDVSPLRGVILGGGAHAVEVGVTVTALA